MADSLLRRSERAQFVAWNTAGKWAYRIGKAAYRIGKALQVAGLRLCAAAGDLDARADDHR